MRRLAVAFILALLGTAPMAPGLVAPAHAVLITYTETATVSGTLNGVAFSNQVLTLSGTGDSATIANPSPGVFRNVLPGATFTLSGGGAGTFTNSIIAVSNNSLIRGGFSDLTQNFAILFTDNAAFAAYNLSTAFGPVSGAVGFNPSLSFPTNAGLLNIASVAGNTATFQAAVREVPEPATLALLGFGLAGLGLARRRRG